MKNKKKCFIIMPFSTTNSCTEQEWAGIFKGIIKPAVEESRLGYECERSVAERENIIKGILEALNKANVVIADLTDNNPNVFYELGVRHTLTNRTILIAQGEKHIPFDLRPYPTTFYNKSLTNIEEFKSDIKKKLQDIERNPDRPDNPVADFLKEKNIALLSYEKKANLARLSALISELSHNISAVDNILDAVKQSKEMSAKDKMTFRVSNVRYSNSCLQLLFSSSYIALPQEMLKDIHLVNEQIRLMNAKLDLWGQPHFLKDVEEWLEETLPKTKGLFIPLLKKVAKIHIDYTNDNYQEPEVPVILLASEEHEEYLKTT